MLSDFAGKGFNFLAHGSVNIVAAPIFDFQLSVARAAVRFSKLDVISKSSRFRICFPYDVACCHIWLVCLLRPRQVATSEDLRCVEESEQCAAGQLE